MVGINDYLQILGRGIYPQKSLTCSFKRQHKRPNPILVLKFILGCEAWKIKQKKSSWGSTMNNTFPLFYFPKPRSQVWILICRKWCIALYSLPGFKIITLWTCLTIKRTFPWSIIVMDKSPIFAVKAAVIYKGQLVWVETSWKKKGWKMDR